MLQPLNAPLFTAGQNPFEKNLFESHRPFTASFKPFHESYRLIANGVSIRMDGNDNSYQPGDYQAGGGRRHSKTLVIDGRTENPRF